MIGDLWNLVFIQPISEALLWLMNITGSLGIAIIILTIIIQLAMTPLRLPSLKSAKKIRGLQPELTKLKEKHKEDRMALAQAQMDLYKEHGVSPFGGIVPTLLSIPIIFALYRVLLTTLTEIEGISTGFLWLNLTSPDSIYILPLLVAGGQYILSKHMMTNHSPPAENKGSDGKKNDSPEEVAQAVQSQMKYIFPIITGVITLTLPSGVGLYWLTSNVFAIIQHQMVERWT